MAVCAWGCGARMACPQRRGVAVATAATVSAGPKEGVALGSRGERPGSSSPMVSVCQRLGLWPACACGERVAEARGSGRTAAKKGSLWPVQVVTRAVAKPQCSIGDGDAVRFVSGRASAPGTAVAR